jgi:hypothetical protein
MRFSVAKSLVFAGCALLAGCSMSLTKYDLQEYPKTIPFFEPITIAYGGDTLSLDTNLQRAYTRVIDTLSYPMESCRGVAHIDASVTQDEQPSAWNVGLAFVPFWPFAPVKETWTYRMDVRIFCNGSLTFKAELEESEHVDAFWFGKFRAGLVNDASQEMHRKLLERIRYETQLGRNTDLNSAQDF